jgi:hypothetical protein
MDVAPHGVHAAMAGLVQDGAFGFAGRGGGRSETGSQAVSSEPAGGESQSFDLAFQHNPDAFARKSFGQHLVMAVHHPEQRTRVNRRRDAPGIQSPEGTTRCAGRRIPRRLSMCTENPDCSSQYLQ